MPAAWRVEDNSMRNRVVISGAGVLAANGSGVDAFWSSLLAGKSGIGPITLFDASDLPCRIAGEISDFDPLRYMDASVKPRRMGRFAQMAVACAKMAVDDAGLSPAALARQREIPIVLGVSTTAMDLVDKRPTPFTAVAAIPHAATSAVGYMFDINTKLLTISNGCASSLDAVATAALHIQAGQTDIAIAGGAESSMTRYVFQSMLKTRRCSTRNHDPAGASRPFDRNRDRGVMAEGSGMVILENYEHAVARGAAIYAEYKGYASCADPREGEEGAGLAKAMHLALANTGLSPLDIDYISAHGPSDIEMDVTETRMIKSVFGDRAYELPITSIKGATGCPMGAGGVHQLIAASMSMREGLLPPTANLESPDPACDLDYVAGRYRMAQIERALINTHGFGRGNGCMIIEGMAAA